MKKIITVFISLMIITTSTFAMYQYQPDGHGRKMMHGGKGKLEMKIMHILRGALKNKEELNLSNDQVSKLKSIKTDTKKELIKKQSEIDILKIDIKSFLHEDKINIEAVNKLIDSKYDIKKSKAKYLVVKLAEVKLILNNDQLKKICKISHRPHKMKSHN